MERWFTEKRTFNKILIFDLDGTLVDSFKAHMKSFNQAFINNNLPFVKEEKIIKFFGLPSEGIIKKLFPKLKYDKIKKIGKEKRKIFLNKNYKLVKIFPKVNLTLKKLKNKYFLVLITNSSNEEIKKIAKITRLKLNYFDIIISKEKVKRRKPNTEAIKKIEKIVGKNKEKFIIGDSYVDIIFAKKAKAKSIIIINKINKKILKEIKKYKPDYLLYSFDEILSIVN